MSKSYGNVIPLLEDKKVLRKSVMKIVTNSLEPGVPKNPDDCTVFDLYKNFADDNSVSEFKKQYENGISWGEAKEILFDAINAELKPIRSRYEDLIKDKNYINDVLSDGSKKTRLLAQEKISEIREVIGIKRIS